MIPVSRNRFFSPLKASIFAPIMGTYSCFSLLMVVNRYACTATRHRSFRDEYEVKNKGNSITLLPSSAHFQWSYVSSRVVLKFFALSEEWYNIIFMKDLWVLMCRNSLRRLDSESWHLHSASPWLVFRHVFIIARSIGCLAHCCYAPKSLNEGGGQDCRMAGLACLIRRATSCADLIEGVVMPGHRSSGHSSH